jgi:hypothetical protein
LLPPRNPQLRRALARKLRIRHKLGFSLLALLFLAGLARLAPAQDKDDPLTDAQVEKLREVADQPPERLKLYMEFISQRADAIAEMVGDTRIQNKPPKMRQLLQEYTRLVDELEDNLDNYDETHADIRKVLKELVPASKKWLDTVNKTPPDSVYDFPRKTAADASESLVDQVTKLQTDLDKYFAEQKKEKKEQDKTGYVPQSPQ